MKIGILGGTGRMGQGLARGYAAVGHKVFLGSRSPGRAADIASELAGGVSGGSLAEAAEFGELGVLAVPFGDAVSTVEPLRDALDGKIVVDITNPFGAVPPGRVAGIEHNCQAAPSARWVAAYKTTFWKTLDDAGGSDSRSLDVFVCSQDDEAKAVVMELITATGFRAIDCGGFENARTLDVMVPLMIELDGRLRTDARSSWKFLG